MTKVPEFSFAFICVFLRPEYYIMTKITTTTSN